MPPVAGVVLPLRQNREERVTVVAEHRWLELLDPSVPLRVLQRLEKMNISSPGSPHPPSCPLRSQWKPAREKLHISPADPISPCIGEQLLPF